MSNGKHDPRTAREEALTILLDASMPPEDKKSALGAVESSRDGIYRAFESVIDESIMKGADMVPAGTWVLFAWFLENKATADDWSEDPIKDAAVVFAANCLDAELLERFAACLLAVMDERGEGDGSRKPPLFLCHAAVAMLENPAVSDDVLAGIVGDAVRVAWTPQSPFAKSAIAKGYVLSRERLEWLTSLGVDEDAHGSAASLERMAMTADYVVAELTGHEWDKWSDRYDACTELAFELVDLGERYPTREELEKAVQALEAGVPLDDLLA